MTHDNPPSGKPSESSRLGRAGIWLVVLALLAFIPIAFLGGRWFSGGLEVATTPTAVPTEAPVPSPTPVIITDAGALRRIESTEILQTTMFRIDTLVRAKKEGSWFFNWGGQNLLLFVKGKVAAGIDLKELQAGNVSVSQDRRLIVIRLPPAKVLNATLESYEIEDFEGNKPGSVDTNLLKDGLEAGRRQVAATACEDGILEHATNDAKAAFERILSFAEFADYQVLVTTSPPANCTFDVVGTPQPQP